MSSKPKRRRIDERSVRMAAPANVCRILSLDGGGTWALIQARALERIYGESTRGHEVLKRFDYVVANSGGSIVAGALYKNMALKDIVAHFRPKFRDNVSARNAMFRPTNTVASYVWYAVFGGPKWQTSAKLASLLDLLGEADGLGTVDLRNAPIHDLHTTIPTNELGKAKAKLVIVALDYDRQRAKLFRSWLGRAQSDPTNADVVTLAEAIHASSTAPVPFFDAPAELSDHRRYWDGAISGNNNPVLVGITEARAEHPDKAVHVLSIGTGNVSLAPRPVGPGAVQPDDAHAPLFAPARVNRPDKDVYAIAHAIIDDPPDSASFLAHMWIDGTVPGAGEPPLRDTRIVRMNPMVQPRFVAGAEGHWEFPACYDVNDASRSTFAHLSTLAMDAVSHDDVVAVDDLALNWLDNKVANQPIQANTITKQARIGHDTFGQALERWSALAETCLNAYKAKM